MDAREVLNFFNLDYEEVDGGYKPIDLKGYFEFTDEDICKEVKDLIGCIPEPLFADTVLNKDINDVRDFEDLEEVLTYYKSVNDTYMVDILQVIANPQRLEENANHIQELENLKMVLREYDENGSSSKHGIWEIHDGGYDRWWELCKNGEPIIGCLASGEYENGVEIGNLERLSNISYNERDVIFGIIADNYSNVRTSPNEPFSLREIISNEPHLLQDLVEAGNWHWHMNNIESKAYSQQYDKQFKKVLHNLSQKPKLSVEEIHALANYYYKPNNGNISKEDHARNIVKEMIMDGFSDQRIKTFAMANDDQIDSKETYHYTNKVLGEPFIKELKETVKNYSKNSNKRR